jgi:lysophospholipase L1-like esterase
MKRIIKWTLYIIITLFVCVEIALQIYNPFSSRVKNGQVILPKNTVYEMDLPEIPGLDRHLKHSKNSLGFRGDELTDSNALKIICMGGSTTECFYLNDGKDWPAMLGTRLKKDNPDIWLNNAGMDGHSSFGNLQMLKQYVLKLKPDYILLMCGLNDMSLKQPSKHDEYSGKWYQKAYNFLETPSTIVNIMRAGKAKQSGLNHQYFKDISKADTFYMTDSQIYHRLESEKTFLKDYKKRIKEFARLCKENNIQLIFVSQSILFADERDLMTNVDLGLLKTGEINGKTRSYILKMYNKSTFNIAKELNLPFINLSARLPKDSRFFYDGYHFTNEGAEIAADIIYDDIKTDKLIPLTKKKKK